MTSRLRIPLRLSVIEAAVFAVHAGNGRARHWHSERAVPQGCGSIHFNPNNGDMKKVATIMYAVGWTPHSFGTQIIRTAAILQLLGNLGRPEAGLTLCAATPTSRARRIWPDYLTRCRFF
jgi:hypothetical protein